MLLTAFIILIIIHFESFFHQSVNHFGNRGIPVNLAEVGFFNGSIFSPGAIIAAWLFGTDDVKSKVQNTVSHTRSAWVDNMGCGVNVFCKEDLWEFLVWLHSSIFGVYKLIKGQVFTVWDMTRPNSFARLSNFTIKSGSSTCIKNLMIRGTCADGKCSSVNLVDIHVQLWRVCFLVSKKLSFLLWVVNLITADKWPSFQVPLHESTIKDPNIVSTIMGEHKPGTGNWEHSLGIIAHDLIRWKNLELFHMLSKNFKRGHGVR